MKLARKVLAKSRFLMASFISVFLTVYSFNRDALRTAPGPGPRGGGGGPTAAATASAVGLGASQQGAWGHPRGLGGAPAPPWATAAAAVGPEGGRAWVEEGDELGWGHKEIIDKAPTY